MSGVSPTLFLRRWKVMCRGEILGAVRVAVVTILLGVVVSACDGGANPMR